MLTMARQRKKETKQMADYDIADTVDITDVVCPVTFVKAKVALEELDEGQVLSVKLIQPLFSLTN